jgi:outer membrane protein assembly factor BamB
VFLISKNGKVKAFDARTGKPVWEFAYSTSRAECPTALSLSQGALYFGGGELDNTPGKGRFLWALDADTGKELWRFAAKPDTYTSGECVQAPAVSEGIVVTSARNTMFALDAKSGKLLWSKKAEAMVDGRNKIFALSEPLIAQGTVYATSIMSLRGWNLRTGAPEFDLPGVFGVEPAIDRMASAGGILYFAGELEPAPKGETAEPRWPLYALDLKTKQILWKHRTNRPSRFASVAQWRTRSFLPLDGAVVYENESILVKLQ